MSERFFRVVCEVTVIEDDGLERRDRVHRSEQSFHAADADSAYVQALQRELRQLEVERKPLEAIAA